MIDAYPFLIVSCISPIFLARYANALLTITQCSALSEPTMFVVT